MTKLTELKARFMEDPAFREEYARIDGGYALIEALVRARTAAKLTQAELASRLGTTQSAVARLEGGRVSPSFATLRRYAEATGTRLTVDGQGVPGRGERRIAGARPAERSLGRRGRLVAVEDIGANAVGDARRGRLDRIAARCA